MTLTTTYLFVIFETILVLVCLFAANNGATEGLCFFTRETEPLNELLLAKAFRQLAVVGKLTWVLESAHATLFAEQTLGGVIDAARLVLLAIHVGEAKARHAGVKVGRVNFAGRVHSRLGRANSLRGVSKSRCIYR